MGRYFLLDENKNVVTTDDLIKWGEAFEIMNRRVARTRVKGHDISTVFLGLNFNFFRGGPPHFFETMDFQRRHFGGGNVIGRTPTWGAALDVHKRVVKDLRLSNRQRKIKQWRLATCVYLSASLQRTEHLPSDIASLKVLN